MPTFGENGILGSVFMQKVRLFRTYCTYVGASSEKGSLGMLSENSCFGIRQYMIQTIQCQNITVILAHLSGNYSIIKMGQNASSTNGTCTDACQENKNVF